MNSRTETYQFIYLAEDGAAKDGKGRGAVLRFADEEKRVARVGLVPRAETSAEYDLVRLRSPGVSEDALSHLERLVQAALTRGAALIETRDRARLQRPG